MQLINVRARGQPESSATSPSSPRPAYTYTAREQATLQSLLAKQLGPEYLSSKPGPGHTRVQYLATSRSFELANELFGFNGWSTSIRDVQISTLR